MCFKVNHYTYLNMLCESLQMHQEGRVTQGEPGPFQKQVTHKVSGTKLEPYCYHSYRHHHGGCLFKGGGGG